MTEAKKLALKVWCVTAMAAIPDEGTSESHVMLALDRAFPGPGGGEGLDRLHEVLRILERAGMVTRSASYWLEPTDDGKKMAAAGRRALRDAAKEVR